jgi:deaminated glutathione amidase
VCLPENFGFMGGEADKLAYAQDVEGGAFLAPMRALARKHGIGLLAGSIPERGPDATHVYNTSVLLGRDGETLAVYRKIHLFDVDFGRALALRESKHVTPGSEPVLGRFDGWGVGLTVCYDLRFPELYRRLVSLGAQMLFVPAAFTLHTGKDHWEVLLRARAIENQCFVVAPAQFGEHTPGRVSWGKAMVIDPWGAVLAVAPERPGLAVACVSLADELVVREKLPSLAHRRL